MWNKMCRTTMTFRSASWVLGCAFLIAVSLPARGELKGILAGWEAKAEVSYVVTGGNSSTSAFSLGTALSRNWEKDKVIIKSYLLRSFSTDVTRTAVGTEADFAVTEEQVQRLVAENYSLSGQYDHRISKKFRFQAGIGWDRNRFAGVAGRFVFSAGAGYAFLETERTEIKTNAGLTFTMRKYIGEELTSFAGFRWNFEAEHKIGENSSLSSHFIFDENLKKTEDWRFDWTNSAAASLSNPLAIKVSLRFLYSHLPALESIPLFDAGGVDTGLTVRVPLKKLDTIFTTSLVINF